MPEYSYHSTISPFSGRNGRAMVLGGESLQLVVFMMDDWSAQKIIEFPESFRGVRKVEFIADLFDGGANKVSNDEGDGWN